MAVTWSRCKRSQNYCFSHLQKIRDYWLLQTLKVKSATVRNQKLRLWGT